VIVDPMKSLWFAIAILMRRVAAPPLGAVGNVHHDALLTPAKGAVWDHREAG
jgi:hypothetical protein